MIDSVFLLPFNRVIMKIIKVHKIIKSKYSFGKILDSFYLISFKVYYFSYR